MSKAEHGGSRRTRTSRAAASDIECELRARLANEDRLTRLATIFVSTPADRFDDGVAAALAEIGSLDGVDRVNVWCRRGDELHHLYEWTADSIERTIDKDLTYPIAAGGRFVQILSELGEVHIPDVTKLDDSWHEERTALIERGVRSLLSVPMVEDGVFAGSISFSSLHLEPIFASSHLSTLRTAAGILSQAFAHHAAAELLAFQARVDSVTGLGNRWAIYNAVTDGLTRMRGGESPGLAVLMLDLDRFKVVNDSLGHVAGDDLLGAVASRLRAELQECEYAARFGGDEIVLVLDGCVDETKAGARAHDLLDALRHPFHIHGHEVFVTASVGVTVCREVDADPNELLRQADVAMYAAKKKGRNGALVYNADVRDGAHERLDRETDLRHAVDGDQLVLYFQPEIDLVGGEIVGTEALVRWNHPRRGLLNPGDFIGLAEETGVIADIGAWVLQAACRQLAAWSSSGAQLTMRVNLSARQLSCPGLVESVADVISWSGVAPSSVCLEITETALMADAEQSLEVLNRLHEHGLGIAVDDFGTGYSSLAYLKRLPVDLLKIDQSFVAGLPDDADDVAIVRAILSLAEALGLHVTAEGVETLGQLQALRDLGCRRAQGYLFARPMPADAITNMLFVP